jgi:hypothetical protein
MAAYDFAAPPQDGLNMLEICGKRVGTGKERLQAISQLVSPGQPPCVLKCKEPKMCRTCYFICAMFLLVCPVRLAHAEEPYMTWWKYLEGQWTYKIVPVDETGTATWRIAVKGNALIGRFEEDTGHTGIELSGWQGDREAVNGYGSQGNYWTMVLTKHTEDVTEGENAGKLPE